MTPRPGDNAPMVEHALWYAQEMGWPVFPVLAPLFDHPTGYTCCCEFYRHTDACKNNPKHQYLYLKPDQHCDHPGKCPAVKWAAKATTDPAQIRAWWQNPRKFVDHRTRTAYFFTMNIGRHNGQSGILTLDADTYKDAYQGVGQLTQADEETVINLTGGGGTHFDYAMPLGKAYGNGTGNLPDGIDIRGVGGYTILPPSLHKSGRRYAYELDHAPDDIALLPVPNWLCAILDAEPTNSAKKLGPSNVPAVRDSEQIVAALLEQAELLHSGAQEWNGNGRKWVLSECPFSDEHADGAYIVVHRDGMIGAGCHHSTCQNRIKESGVSGWRLLKQITNYRPVYIGNGG